MEWTPEMVRELERREILWRVEGLLSQATVMLHAAGQRDMADACAQLETQSRRRRDVERLAERLNSR
jgi:hypothetical protein